MGAVSIVCSIRHRENDSTNMVASVTSMLEHNGDARCAMLLLSMPHLTDAVYVVAHA